MTQNSLYAPSAAGLGLSAPAPDGRALLAERIAEALRGTGEVWLLTGERGSGRTTLLGEAIARLPVSPARLVRVRAEPDGDKLSLRDFVAQIAGGPDPAQTPSGDVLERAFDLLAGDEPAVLVVDGADGLATEVLRYIQFVAKSAPGLQVLFVARPGFRAVLEQDEFARLRSRLAPELVVPRLSDEDAVRFVRRRLRAVRASPVQMAEGPALGVLVRAGQGLPGRLAGLLDRALAAGASRGDELLTPAAVQRAVHELDRPHEPFSPAEPPAAPAPIRAAPPAPVVPDPQPAEAARSWAKLTPPRPAPRWPVLVPLAAALVVVGLGAWAVVTLPRGAPAPSPPQASLSPQAAAPAPDRSVPDRLMPEAARPAPFAPQAQQTPPAAMPAPAPDTPAQGADRPAPSAQAPLAQPPIPRATVPQASIPPDLLAVLLSRGEAMLAVGDVSAARLLFERAASGGDPLALRAAGRAYDPAVLARLGAVGIRPDAARAAEYYGRAAALGDAEARRLLRQLGAAGATR